jgi:hypothetical protein
MTAPARSLIRMPALALVMLVAFVAARSRPHGGRAAPLAADAEQEARTLCGAACHAYPPPDILPRRAWADSIARMTLFRAGLPEPPGPPGSLAKKVPLPEDMRRVLAFYEAHAPEALPPPPAWPPLDGRMRFRKHPLQPKDRPATPAVSNVRFVDLDGSGRLAIVVADMRHGLILRGDPRAPDRPLEPIALVPHPARVEPADLDADGLRDLLVADLGSFFPGNHQNGAVVWLRRTKEGAYAEYDMGGFPRVADVRAADFDGDGRRDLAVGAFGWRTVGHIAILFNRTTDPQRPSFDQTRIDERTGTINVVALQLDDDGRLDLLALLSQQHERVVAYLNRADGFQQQLVYAAPHPNWGSSGMDVADLDGDGDLDVIVSHGDSFDDDLVKPYHGIEWLENRGRFPYVARSLAVLPGVHRAMAVDFDGDRDLDVVAGAFLAQGAGAAAATAPSLVWLEQTRPGTFERRTLEIGRPYHASIDAADYDEDGDVDLVVGNFIPVGELPTWVELWENLEKSK